MLSSFFLAVYVAFLASIAAAADSCTNSRTTLHYWRLSASSAEPFVQIHQTVCPSKPTEYSLELWKPEKLQELESDEIVRVGRFLPGGTKELSNWDGTITSAGTFKAGVKKVLTVYLDNEGKISHGAFAPSSQPPKGDGKDEVEIVVKSMEPEPKPVLNRPVVLDETGKVKTEQKDERTFLQK